MKNTVDGVPQVDPDEAAALLAQGAQLLDVRERAEWLAGHAPDAVHIPLGHLAAEYDGAVARDRTVVAVCRVGGRSQHAARALRDAGYDAVNVAGGMQAWAAAGRPVVTDDGASGEVI